MPTPRYDLIDVIQTIRQRIRFVIIVTVLAVIAGGVFHLVKKKKYQAKAEFMVSNPVYADRYTVYGMDHGTIDYFANDDDIDKIIIYGESDMVLNMVIKNQDLAHAYGIDTTELLGKEKLKMMVRKKMDIKRSEYRHVILKYDDADPVLAANVANGFVNMIGQAYQEYYNGIRTNLYASVSATVMKEDSTVTKLTDSLTILRDKYGIYDIISPARFGLIYTGIKTTGKPEFARGLEEVQNIEAMKDQILSDKVKHMSLLNQYSTGVKMNETPLLKVVTVATTPVKADGLNGILTLVAAAIIGFVFSVLFSLIAAYYRALITYQR